MGRHRQGIRQSLASAMGACHCRTVEGEAANGRTADSQTIHSQSVDFKMTIPQFLKLPRSLPWTFDRHGFITAPAERRDCNILRDEGFEIGRSHNLMFTDVKPPPGWLLYVDDDGCGASLEHIDLQKRERKCVRMLYRKQLGVIYIHCGISYQCSRMSFFRL